MEPQVFLYFGLGVHEDTPSTESLRKCVASYGATPRVCSITWNKLINLKRMPRGGKPNHLLWAFMLLKTYQSIDYLSLTTRVATKTFRKWSWLFIKAISSMEDDLVS